MRSALLLTLICLSTAAAAQEKAPADVPATEAAPPSVEDRLTTVTGRLDSLEEQYAETKTSVLSLSRLKLSGYVQGRYQYAENSFGGLSASGSPLVKDGFTVRRGRLKATYKAPHSSYVVQIDATPKGVALKDAEASFHEPWLKKLTLTVGQTKWPFGYEVNQSSGDREFPERTRVVRAFAPGERDRGAKLSTKLGVLRAAVGVFDGNGTEHKAFPGVDNDTEKDVVGRVGFDIDWLSGGVSGWAGKTFQPGDYSGTNNLPGRFHARNRLGVDLQAYLDLLPFGATAIKGEWIAGTSWMDGGIERFGQPAVGWYALVVQNLGLSNQVAIRYDYFDGFAGTPDKADAADPSRPASSNATGTLGLLVMHHLDEALKVSAVYELPMTNLVAGVNDPADNLFTLQLQAKF